MYYCHNCQSPHLQPMGRQTSSVSARTQQTNHKYHNAHGPPTAVSDKCQECGGRFSVSLSLDSSLWTWVEMSDDRSLDRFGRVLYIRKSLWARCWNWLGASQRVLELVRGSRGCFLLLILYVSLLFRGEMIAEIEIVGNRSAVLFHPE